MRGVRWVIIAIFLIFIILSRVNCHIRVELIVIAESKVKSK